ncbi:polyamine ABC transporter substrate-binding protein [Truepera radiovictrix]|uniref:polyamine ABC transporter substrate-binding protein n=1 Tax=Truepera radiovictrix TaxID=332249 RepID=UPI000674312D|nr:spermidine/putrescine ABC transporter substrate-binding protein [Truepera radiovictrix]WMT58238.1 spermidine/putrescine ABC transporter substrate-binding protein [Truepera radiovictrix]
MALGLFAVCASAAAQEGWTCPEGFAGQRLNVYNWTTYIAEDTIANFEALCDVSVTYDTYPTEDDMLARIRQGNPGYDIVVPSGTIMVLMINEGLLEPLNLENIPNVANLDDTFLDLPFDPGNQYSLPYQWGTVGIGYNRTRVGGEITSWREMFAYEGPVSWLEDVRGIMGVALLLAGFDPNSTDPDEIAAARDFLIDNGSNVVYINQDDGQEVLLRGEADIVMEYSGDIFQIIEECDCDDFAYVIPEEGTYFWVDNVAIPVGAQNRALAEVFIDYLLDPQVGADISNFTAYGSPNRAAIEAGLIDEALLNNPGIYPSEEVEERLFTIINDPEAEGLYNDAWDEVKIFVGG